MPTKAPPIVSCPHCGKEHQWDTNNRQGGRATRGAGSERCKLIDLGKWANEDYRVEQREQELSEEISIPVSFRS